LPQAGRPWCHDTSTSVISGEGTNSFCLVGCLLDLTAGRLGLVSVHRVHHHPQERNLQKLLHRRTSSILGMRSRRKYCVDVMGTQSSEFPFHVVRIKGPNTSRDKKVHRSKLFRLAMFPVTHMIRHRVKHNAEKDFFLKRLNFEP